MVTQDSITLGEVGRSNRDKRRWGHVKGTVKKEGQES